MWVSCTFYNITAEVCWCHECVGVMSVLVSCVCCCHACVGAMGVLVS